MSEARGSFFVDTNVLLYSISASETEKRPLAHDWMASLWRSSSGRISWQVLHEFYSNAVGKLSVPSAIARKTVEELVLWSPTQPGINTFQRAWHWCDSAKINFWDALIVAAAEQADCHWLLSEDFQSGRKFGQVTVVNPFQHAPFDFDLT